jgi:CheY-like chemotaxis protein
MHLTGGQPVLAAAGFQPALASQRLERLVHEETADIKEIARARAALFQDFTAVAEVRALSTVPPIPVRRALVVDDNPVNLKITAALVRRAGFLTDMVETAEAALQRLDANRPDLIVTDLHLPGMDGLDLTRAIKRKPAWESILVILLTADNSMELEITARQAGCECLIAKPVDAKLFPGLIAGFLGTSAPTNYAPSLDDLPLEDLRKQFLTTGAAECRHLLSQLTANRLFVPELDFASLRSALHRWAGVGGTVGFPDVTRQARALEVLADTCDPAKTNDLRDRLMELLRQFTNAVPVDQPAAAPRNEIAPLEKVAVTVKRVVLVADDDATIRAVIKLSLEAAGFECRLADNGALTCTMARNDPPDAIILDLNMPRMDGFQVLYALRNSWSTRNVPVILLSARREQKDIVQAAQLGAVDYMTKPFEINDLLVRLDRVIAPKEQTP